MSTEPVPTPPGELFNFAGYLFERNAGHPDKTAFIDDRGRLSYGGLEDRARRIAAGLLAAGVRREERVLLLMEDCNDWPASFLGAIYAGIVPVAVNTLLTVDDYRYMLGHCRASVALTSQALLPVVLEAGRPATGEAPSEGTSEAPSEATGGTDTRAPRLERIIVSVADGGLPQGGLPEGCIDLEGWLADQTPLRRAADTSADDPAFWLYSSGSTGRPKGTVHTQANPYWTAKLYSGPILGLTADDICFSAAKLFFAYGLGNALTFPMDVGATTVLMRGRPTPDACFRCWIEQRPTIFFGAPTGFAGLLASPALPSRDQVALRLASSAGEALPAELGERFTRHFGVEIIDGIGSTEMCHIYLSNVPGRVRYGTTGWPVPGYRIELRGEDGRPVPDGEPGDLYVSGPSSALLYWGNRAKSRETFQGDWTRSGDKYIRNPDGTYTYAGRSDDMLKVSGIYVSPFEIEATLVQHPAILEAAVIGVEDENGLTRSKAFVVLKGSAQVSEEDLKAYVKDRLAPYKYPRQIEFVDELPKTATGKIQRFKLRDKEAR